MPAKKRLVPPLRPNADGTGFVRGGRPGASARARSGGPRRAVTPSESSATSAASSASSRSSSVEAAAVAPRRVGQGRAGAAPPPHPPAKAAAVCVTPIADAKAVLGKSLKPSAPTAPTPQPSGTSSLNVCKALSLPSKRKAPSAVVTTSGATPLAAAQRSKAPGGPAGGPTELEVSVDGALGPSDCMLPAHTLHQLGLLSGSLVHLSTQYGDVYAEARQLRGAAGGNRLVVSEDAAALLVDKRVRLNAVPPQPNGLPLLTSVTLRPSAPEGVHCVAETTAATLASTLEWQAMFRRLLHHKIAYLHLRTTQRVLTQRLALEVVRVAADTAAPGASGASLSSSSLWGVVTDATSLYLEGGESSSRSSNPGATPPSVQATVSTADTAAPLCILVVGESGTGKSRWLTQLSATGQPPSLRAESATMPCSAGRHMVWVRVEELPQGEGSEVSTATALRETFERARLAAPSLLLLDDLHLICARKATSAGSRWAMSLVAHALAEELLDLQRRQQDVWVVASAPSLESLDGCLTETSLFGRHVVTLEMPAGAAERLACLRSCLSDVCRGGGDAPSCSPPCVGEACLAEVAQRAHGFTQRDLHRLAETAVVTAFHARQSVQPGDADLRAAAAVVRPSSLKRFEVSVPSVTWDDIGGSAAAKKTLCDVVEWCLGKQRWIFTEFNLTPPKGVLLYGPPGCSKTMLAKALANESQMNFISVKGPEVFSKWVGDSEKAVRDIFERARAASPCVVFIDELDGMCGHRGRGGVSDRVISQFLTELDGLPAAFEEKKNALVFVAATNRPDSIDSAVLRPGRIDRRVYVGLPSHEERVAITAIQFRSLPVEPALTTEYVAAHTDGYTGAEVVAVVKEAAFHAITADERAACVTVGDVDAALVKVRPRIRPADVEWYRQWPHNTPTKVE